MTCTITSRVNFFVSTGEKFSVSVDRQNFHHASDNHQILYIVLNIPIFKALAYPEILLLRTLYRDVE